MTKKIWKVIVSMYLVCALLMTGILLMEPDSDLLFHAISDCRKAEENHCLINMADELQPVVCLAEQSGHIWLRPSSDRSGGNRSMLRFGTQIAILGFGQFTFHFCYASVRRQYHKNYSSRYIVNYIHDIDGQKILRYIMM
ncbi:MAG: hypothetical protein IJ711_11900 [Lachnospiraceae bacterium]|nr:hypothetical protein [Lachnospiraceae bacterium]